ncbi:MAG: RNA polymerase sigma factor [Candidatus Eisenbacteria bacterium]
MTAGPNSPEPDDAALARRIKRGDPGAFDEFFSRFAGRLLAYLIGMVRNREAAEDLLQEALLRVFRQIETCRDPGAFRAWVYRIATNLAITELRRRRYRGTDTLGPEALDVPDPEPSDPGCLWVESERERAVEDALERLPDDQRVVLLLRVREDMPIAMIAHVIGVPEGTIKSRLHHAVRKLRLSVEQAGSGAVGRDK